MSLLTASAVMLVAEGVAYADELPKVTAALSGVQQGIEPPPPLFDREFPASTPFELRIEAPQSEQVSGTVEVWPTTAGDGGSCPRPFGERQHYRLRMTATGEAPSRFLRAEIPALQVDTKFCVQFNVRRSPTEEELDQIAKKASNELLRNLVNGGSCYADADPPSLQAFARAVTNAASAIEASGTDGAAAVALRTFADKNGATCDELREAIALKTALEANQEVAKGIWNTAVANLKQAAVPGPQRSPYVLLEKKAVLAEALLSAEVKLDDITNAAAQLAKRAGSETDPNQQRVLSLWRASLSGLEKELLNAGPDARKKALKRAQTEFARGETGQLPSLPGVELRVGEEFISAFLLRTTRRVPEDFDKQLDAAHVATNHAFRNAVRDYVEAYKQKEQAETQLKAGKATYNVAFKATRTALLAALKSDATRATLAVDLSVKSQGVTGKGRTEVAANYAAVDAGVAVARPFGSDAQSVWVLPYIGLNLYAVPVDRKVKFGELVGDTFWQRTSLTVGMTLTEPSLEGRTIHSVLFDNYPLAAVGARLTPFTRVTAGAVFYWLDAANPASDEVEFHAAPFLGASLDIDVIHFLTQAKL